MACDPIVNASGQVIGFACSRTSSRRRCACGGNADKLCDYPLQGRKAEQTCDRPICKRCAVSRRVGGDIVDYCQTHARLAADEVRRKLSSVSAARQVEPGGGDDVR